MGEEVAMIFKFFSYQDFSFGYLGLGEYHQILCVSLCTCEGLSLCVISCPDEEIGRSIKDDACLYLLQAPRH